MQVGNPLRVSLNEVKHCVRAKYVVTPEGDSKLVQIQSMSIPVFRIAGYEEVKPENIKPQQLDVYFDELEEISAKDISEAIKDNANDLVNRLRALRRAKITAFDKILANPDLDLFATFTVAPDKVGDRTSYEDCYNKLRAWLNNKVTRNGLKYVLCPERHKKGGIHFHAILNSTAVKLKRAIHAYTGEPLSHNGQQLYNIVDWNLGFSSAEFIQGKASDRENVSKYIFKYMGKQGTDGKIGGRYALSGGKLTKPFYLYGNDPNEFMACEEKFFRECRHEDILYKEWDFI